MASTDAATEHPLGLQHLPGCLTLSEQAHWNQNAADWQWMLGFGRGYGLTLADGTLAASTITLPYGERFAWVSMVLVLPQQRRKGYATRLLRRALEDLSREGRAAILDATPAGREVYRQEGFVDRWGFRRLALTKPVAELASDDPQYRVRPIRPGDWERIARLDAQAFGADRTQLLRELMQRLSASALACERTGEFCGFLLGRDGREANQLGPLVAQDRGAARALLRAALDKVPSPIYLDVVEREASLIDWLQQAGFAFQRPFTRMVRGADRAPGDEALVYCPTGAELG